MKQQPRQAILVKIVKPENKAGEISKKIHDKLTKLQLPSGPAWINGRWE